MPSQPPLPSELPTYFQALINIVGFLIASVAVWYAYFVKGRSKADTDAPPALDNIRALKSIADDVKRLANASEKIYDVLKHESDEAEIQRRVKEQLLREGLNRLD